MHSQVCEKSQASDHFRSALHGWLSIKNAKPLTEKMQQRFEKPINDSQIVWENSQNRLALDLNFYPFTKYNHSINLKNNISLILWKVNIIYQLMVRYFLEMWKVIRSKKTNLKFDKNGQLSVDLIVMKLHFFSTFSIKPKQKTMWW